MNLVELVLFIGLLSASAIGQDKSAKKTDAAAGTLSPRSETADSKGETPAETYDEEECNCTPFHLCKSFMAKEDGDNLIDIRINIAPSCQSYMDVCCKDKPISDENHETDKKHDSGDKHDSEGKHDSDKKHDSEKEHDSDKKHGSDKNNDSEKEHGSDKKHDSEKEHSSDKKNHSDNYDLDKKYESDKKKDSNEKHDMDKKYGSDEKQDSDKKHDSETKHDSDKKHDTNKKEDSHDKYDHDKTTTICDCKGGYNEEVTEKPNGQYEKKPNHSEDHTESSHEENSEKHTTEAVHEHAHEEPKCGQWNKDGVGFRIVNAIDGESQYGEYPSMVAIFMEDSTNELKHTVHCGGSLIKKNVVLTAAHCVIKKSITNMVVRAGEWDLKTEKEVYAHQDRRVVKVITHQDYYAGGLHNDVALIFTEEPFYLQENVQTICLPKQDEHFIDERCFSCGWGKTVSYNNYTIHKKTAKSHEIGKYEVSILKKVQVPVVKREKCTSALRSTRLGPKFVLHDSFLCAGGEEGIDTCRGDGGGPLMCPSKDDPHSLVQAGIVAWGIQCGLRDIPAVYVDVASFRNWIDEKLEYYETSLPKETN